MTCRWFLACNFNKRFVHTWYSRRVLLSGQCDQKSARYRPFVNWCPTSRPVWLVQLRHWLQAGGRGCYSGLVFFFFFFFIDFSNHLVWLPIIENNKYTPLDTFSLKVVYQIACRAKGRGVPTFDTFQAILKVVIKCCFVWPINSCDLIWANVCVLDTVMFERRWVMSMTLLCVCGTG